MNGELKTNFSLSHVDSYDYRTFPEGKYVKVAVVNEKHIGYAHILVVGNKKTLLKWNTVNNTEKYTAGTTTTKTTTNTTSSNSSSTTTSTNTNSSTTYINSTYTKPSQPSQPESPIYNIIKNMTKN